MTFVQPNKLLKADILRLIQILTLNPILYVESQLLINFTKKR
ncbi:hypothetical protein T190130A13A_40081 [Tenacibaculum sp. 190130A14a]